jgi:cytochrome o ubiquinol oxidase operon protein cyoD
MSHSEQDRDPNHADAVPGYDLLDEREAAEGIASLLIGLGLATLLTIVSFFIARTTLVWQPSIPVALAVLAIAQMGVHLVFFLHITSGPDNTNNVLALAFGVLIVFLVIVGTIWIMAHMNANMGVSPELMNLQMQH